MHNAADHSEETANDGFKRKASDWMAFGVMGAVFAHFGFFALFPTLQAADLTGSDKAIEAIVLPPDTNVPPPPEQIQRPALPQVADLALDKDETIAPTDWIDDVLLPPPPTAARPDDRPSFIPHDVAPKLKNVSEIQTLLQRSYPAQLREAGVEGTVVLWIYVDEAGQVQRPRVKTSSGHAPMDDAAISVAGRMQFTPAMNRDKKTPVWVSQAITFQIANR